MSLVRIFWLLPGKYWLWMLMVMPLTVVITLTGFFTIVVTCLARSTPKQSSEFVWTNFVNESGWADGISFLTGLISPNYMYAGIDGAIHLAEECRNPARVVPRAIVSTLLIGFVTSFMFAVAMTYSIGDFDAVITTATGYGDRLCPFSAIDADRSPGFPFMRSGIKLLVRARLPLFSWRSFSLPQPLH